MSLSGYNQGTMTLYNPAGNQQQPQQPQLHDDMGSLLHVLGAVFGTYPGLWYDGMAVESYQLVSGLMSFVSAHYRDRWLHWSGGKFNIQGLAEIPSWQHAVT